MASLRQRGRGCLSLPPRHAKLLNKRKLPPLPDPTYLAGIPNRGLSLPIRAFGKVATTVDVVAGGSHIQKPKLTWNIARDGLRIADGDCEVSRSSDPPRIRTGETTNNPALLSNFDFESACVPNDKEVGSVARFGIKTVSATASLTLIPGSGIQYPKKSTRHFS